MRLWRRERDDLLDQEFILAIPEPISGDFGEHVLESDTPVALIGTESSDGRLVLPAFTSEQRMTEWQTDGSYFIGLEGHAMLGLFLQGTWEAVLIDPNHSDGRTVWRDEAEELLAGK